MTFYFFISRSNKPKRVVDYCYLLNFNQQPEMIISILRLGLTIDRINNISLVVGLTTERFFIH